MPVDSICVARTLTDLPQARLHILDCGHWLLETHLDEVVALMREFLEEVGGA